MDVDCVIVTYNRLKLLKECLNAVINQTKEVNNIIIVNNNSSDDTKLFLKSVQKNNKHIKVLNLKKNIGGAGGFNIGMKYFIKYSNSNYVWIMDDDAIPLKNALEELEKKAKILDNFGFLASDVRWIDNAPCKMNTPILTDDWSIHLDLGILKIKQASFVSLLFPRETIVKVGYPIADFFIWGDDVEYTTRIIKNDLKCYMVPSSKIIHKIYKNIPTSIVDETNKKRLKRYYYDSRNSFYIDKKFNGNLGIARETLRLGYHTAKLLFSNAKYKKEKIKYITQGYIKGIFFNPKVERVDK